MDPGTAVDNSLIVNSRLALERLRAEAQARIETVQAHLKALQKQCQHPNAVRTYHMGEGCWHCHDCGACS